MTSAGEASDSLVEALTKARITTENHAFIRQITEAVGITTYRAVDTAKPHVVATRRDGRRDLHIYYGYTVGFGSEEEIVGLLGDSVGRKPSSSPRGTWYVEHPANRIYSTNTRSRDVRRAAQRCSCGLELSLTGVCASCD
ncbi:hypothetical protein ACWDUN_13490 [Mycobacterium sp. NPDC003323]